MTGFGRSAHVLLGRMSLGVMFPSVDALSSTAQAPPYDAKSHLENPGRFNGGSPVIRLGSERRWSPAPAHPRAPD